RRAGSTRAPACSSMPAPSSLDRRWAGVVESPAHSRGKIDGVLCAWLKTGGCAELEGFELPAEQIDIVHRLSALVPPIEDAHGKRVVLALGAHGDVFRSDGDASGGAGFERLKSQGGDLSAIAEIDEGVV